MQLVGRSNSKGLGEGRVLCVTALRMRQGRGRKSQCAQGQEEEEDECSQTKAEPAGLPRMVGFPLYSSIKRRLLEGEQVVEETKRKAGVGRTQTGHLRASFPVPWTGRG
jgi:hypothetical protein